VDFFSLVGLVLWSVIFVAIMFGLATLDLNETRVDLFDSLTDEELASLKVSILSDDSEVTVAILLPGSFEPIVQGRPETVRILGRTIENRHRHNQQETVRQALKPEIAQLHLLERIRAFFSIADD
jgi:hypothetical protein